MKLGDFVRYRQPDDTVKFNGITVASTETSWQAPRKKRIGIVIGIRSIKTKGYNPKWDKFFPKEQRFISVFWILGHPHTQYFGDAFDIDENLLEVINEQ